MSYLERPLHVCLVSPLPPPYGGISNWSELIHRYAANFGNIKLLQVDTAPRWRSINELSKPKRIIGGSFQLFRDSLVFINAMLTKPDVVHITTSGSFSLVHNMMISFIAHCFLVPTVLHIRFGRVPEIAAKNTLEWYLLKQIILRSDHIIAISPSTEEIISRYIPNVKVKYIPNPIDCSEIPTPSKDSGLRKIALFVGWVLPTKGIEELIRVWSDLSLENWDLLLAGPGSERYQQELLNRYHPENLKFIGELTHHDALQMIAQCDLFILPSHTEGFPNVILESMACGKAILATNVGAIPEMLSGDCGVLIPPMNLIELKQALKILLSNETLRNDLGQRALEKVNQKYCVEIIFRQYVGIWKEIAEDRKYKSTY